MLNFVFIFLIVALAILVVFLLLRVSALQSALSNITARMDHVNKGDFTKKISCKNKLCGPLVSTFNSLLQNMRKFISGMNSSGDKINQTALEITVFTKDIKDRLHHSSEALGEIARTFESQAYAISQTSDKSTKMVDEFQMILEKTKIAQEQSNNTLDIIKHNIPVFDNLTHMVQENANQSKLISQRMADLDIEIQKIHKITETVKSISESTNMLALNASIEAARAGDAGKGFSIVAQEVKKLADESSTNSLEIDHLINSIRREVTQINEYVQEGQKSVSETLAMTTTSKEQFLQSVDSTKVTVDLITDIHDLTTGENTTVTEIGVLMDEAARLAATSTASIQETTSSIQEESHLVDGIFGQLQSLTSMTEDIQTLIRDYAKDFVYTEQTKVYIKNGLNILNEIAGKAELEAMTRKSCDEVLYEAFMRYDFLEFLCIFDKKGDTIGIGIDKEAYDDSMYTNFAHRPYFIESIKGIEYVSQPYISSDSYNYCIAIAVPVKAQGQTIGVLMADLFLG